VSFGRYAGIVLGLTGGSCVLVVPLLSQPARAAAVLGGALAALNTLAAYGLALWSRPRSTKAFLVSVLGGMVGRMGLLLTAVVVALLVFGVPRLPFVISLLSYFVVFLVFELGVLHKTTFPLEVAR
jgi:hypothetical protein